MVNQKARREQVIALLARGDFPGLVEMAGRQRGITVILLQMLYSREDPLSWRAVEGLGCLARAYPAKVQKVIGRLLWLLNEDSGSFGWLAPAALGEIGKQNLSLVEEIILMFFNFLEEEFSRPPMIWGLGRLGQEHPEVIQPAIPRIMECLHDPTPQVRAYAAWCLGVNQASAAVGPLTRLTGDPEPVKLYEAGELRLTTVGDLAREALARLES